MLKRITLHNFMSHSHTVIDLSPGLTVLTGPNNCGKSAFVSALQILAENSSGDFMVRHGAKECSVIVETDDGHTVEWKRKKKTVSYCIDGEDFHRLRNSVPDKLRQVLKLSKVKAGDNDPFDVHFGEQKSPIFLLGERGSRAAAFFASSSDASVLIEMQKLHRSKVKSAQQELQRLQSEFKQTCAIVDVLAPVPDLETKLEELDKTYEALLSEDQQIQQLESFIQGWERSAQSVSKLKHTVQTLNILPEELQQENEKPIELLTQRLQDVNQQVRQTQFNVIALTGLEEPPEMHETLLLKGLINEFQIQDQIHNQAKTTSLYLKHLDEPPALSDTDTLQNGIEKIQYAAERVDVDRAEYKILESCAPPPAMDDIQSLISICQQWKESQMQLDQLQQNCHECNAEHAAVRAELEDWVKKNPSCPTCGAELEPEQFLQAAETGLKGHAHGA